MLVREARANLFDMIRAMLRYVAMEQVDRYVVIDSDEGGFRIC